MLPISYVTSSFVNMLFSFVVIFLILIISRVGFNIKALVYLPLIMMVEYILALGIGMLTAAIDVYFRDMEHILSIITMAWMYLTPIMYTVDLVPEQYMPLFNLNPMTPIIIAYRDILYYKRVPKLGTLIHAFALGVAVLIIGFVVFRKLQRNFAEEL